MALFAFIILFYWVGGIGHLSINRPLHYSGDSLEVLATTRNDIFNDYNTRLRAPFEVANPNKRLYVYRALFDSSSDLMWAAKLIGGGSIVKTLNIAYLFSFLLIFLSGYWVCGRLGLRNPFRFGAASLFALLPYHFGNSTGHFAESCYYFIPLLVLVMMALWSSRPLACRWDGEGWRFTWRDRRIWYALFLLLFLTPFNPYQQLFFACLVVAVAPFAAAYRHNWRPWIVGCGLAVFACAALVLKHALAHYVASPELALGINGQPISGYGGAELYPLKLTQLLLPVQHHRWDLLASFRHMYDVANPMNNENSITTLGFVAAVGFIACMALALVPSVSQRMSRIGKMGLIALMAVLFGSMGGFSSLISTVAMEWLGPRSQLVQARAWNRIAIYIGFLACFTAFWLLQRLLMAAAPRVLHGWRRLTMAWVVGAMVLALGLWDAVPANVAQQGSGHYRSDLQFFATMGQQLPLGSRVFQLPFVVHHASGFVRPGVYYTQMLRPYIASQDLHFTYGGDHLSVQSEWLRAVSALPAARAADYLCRFGFAGVLVQRNMLKNPERLEGEWQSALDEMPETSKDGDYAFFDLLPFCQSHEVQRRDLARMKVHLIEQLGQGRQFFPGGAFSHQIGDVVLNTGGDIVISATKSESGYIAYGPYATLKPGRYHATFRFSSVSGAGAQGALTMDVIARQFKKSRVLAHSSGGPHSGHGVFETRLSFVVNKYDSDIQYRVKKTRGVSVDFLGVDVQRLVD